MNFSIAPATAQVLRLSRANFRTAILTDVEPQCRRAFVSRNREEGRGKVSNHIQVASLVKRINTKSKQVSAKILRGYVLIMIIKFICAFFFSNSGNNLRTHQLQGSLVSLIDRSFDFRLMEVFWNGSIVVSNDKSNPMFSTRQPLEQWPPSRHPSNKTSSNHDPSPPRKLPCTAQSTKAYINVMRP